jgi:separase
VSISFFDILIPDSTRVSSSAVYIEAYEHSERILVEHKGMSSSQRIQSRARRLELSAMACHVFALIQLARVSGVSSFSL